MGAVTVSVTGELRRFPDHIQPAFLPGRMIATPAVGERGVVAVDTRVEATDESALTADAQLVPDATGANVDDTRCDADAPGFSPGIIVSVAGYWFDELDVQVRLDDRDVGPPGNGADRRLVSG